MIQWRETQVSIIFKIRIPNSPENRNLNCMKLLPAKIAVSRFNIIWWISLLEYYMGILTILQENTCRDAVMVDNKLKMYCIMNVYKVQAGKHLVTKNGIVRNFQKNFMNCTYLQPTKSRIQNPNTPNPVWQSHRQACQYICWPLF